MALSVFRSVLVGVVVNLVPVRLNRQTKTWLVRRNRCILDIAARKTIERLRSLRTPAIIRPSSRSWLSR